MSTNHRCRNLQNLDFFSAVSSVLISSLRSINLRVSVLWAGLPTAAGALDAMDGSRAIRMRKLAQATPPPPVTTLAVPPPPPPSGGGSDDPSCAGERYGLGFGLGFGLGLPLLASLISLVLLSLRLRKQDSHGTGSGYATTNTRGTGVPAHTV